MEVVTIKDIAKMCGVATSTVSRAINEHSDISPETRARIMEAIEKTGFIPNNSARNLKRTEAKSIAVLVKGITNPLFSHMIRIIEEEIEAQKYTLVLRHVDSKEDEIDVALTLIKEKRLAGLIFMGGEFVHSAGKLEKITVPYIFSTISARPEEVSESTYSSIAVDDRKESKKMVSYLLDNGHRDIAIITNDTLDHSVGQLRMEGYLEAYREHGIAVNKRLIRILSDEYDQYSMMNGYQVTKELLRSKEPFTAIFCIADVLAIGACRALREAGLLIPKDVSVAGFDGIELGDFVSPRLTTIRQPAEQMAHDTVQCLFEVIGGLKEHRHKTYEGELLIKESTKQIAT
ncbi:MAG: LacI family transcriptional regulator [Lachnospiraceae bacterium]|nr:LacI family transcriptional regulator [Lachnospiraceae bacterium]